MLGNENVQAFRAATQPGDENINLFQTVATIGTDQQMLFDSSGGSFVRPVQRVEFEIIFAGAGQTRIPKNSVDPPTLYIVDS